MLSPRLVLGDLKQDRLGLLRGIGQIQEGQWAKWKDAKIFILRFLCSPQLNSMKGCVPQRESIRMNE